jgi:hypothetical protein
MNFNVEFTKPLLTEPGVKYFLSNTLKQCHDFKTMHYNLILNICIFVGFLVILGSLLLYKYKGKLTDQEKKEKEYIKKQYILNKIKIFQISKQRAKEELITGLPHWETEFDVIDENRK